MGLQPLLPWFPESGPESDFLCSAVGTNSLRGSQSLGRISGPWANVDQNRRVESQLGKGREDFCIHPCLSFLAFQPLSSWGPILSNIAIMMQPCQQGMCCTLWWWGSHQIWIGLGLSNPFELDGLQMACSFSSCWPPKVTECKAGQSKPMPGFFFLPGKIKPASNPPLTCNDNNVPFWTAVVNYCLQPQALHPVIQIKLYRHSFGKL